MTTRRQYAIGLGVLLAFLYAPFVLRLAAGGGDVNAGVLAIVGAISIGAPWAFTVGLRIGDRRKLSPVSTIALGYGLAALTGGALAAIMQLVAEITPGESYLAQVVEAAHKSVVLVGVWGLFMVLPKAIRAERERAALHRDAERARVRAAIEPQFVLNTLNAIGEAIAGDPDTARELVGDLGDVLRDVVRMAEQELQSVATEVAWLERYPERVTTGRQHAIGLGVMLVFLYGPFTLQVATSDVEVTAGLLTLIGAIAITVPWALLAGLRYGDRRKLSLARTIALGYGLATLAGGALAAVWQLVTEVEPGKSYIAQVLQGAYNGVVLVAVWGLFMVMPKAIRAERERAELHRDAERARVRAALEPHFVLNTLNAIGGLIGEEPEIARELVGDLGDLLRDVVQMAEQELQPVATEVAWLGRYTRILEARHAGRLTVEWSVDPAAASVRVPVLVLQPLVENAIQHGALRRPGGGRVRIDIRRVARELRCAVEDNGPGMAAQLRVGANGLALTQRRLAVDAPGGTLELASAPTGTRALVRIPIEGELGGVAPGPITVTA